MRFSSVMTVLLMLAVACSIDTPIATSSDAAPASPVCLEVCNVWELLPATFTGCRGDVNGDGLVTVADWDAVRPHFGLQGSSDPVALCIHDFDGSGAVTTGDASPIKLLYGSCVPLRSFQDGSGVAPGGGPDLRFGGCTP